METDDFTCSGCVATATHALVQRDPRLDDGLFRCTKGFRNHEGFTENVAPGVFAIVLNYTLKR